MLVPVDLSKLINVVKNDVIKKDAYNAKIKSIEDEIPDITNLGTNTTLNAKRNEVKSKTPSIANLATTAALNATENKITNVSNLVKRNEYNTKIDEIENKVTVDHDQDKYITTQEFDNLTSESFFCKMSKNDIANFVKKTDFDDKLNNSMLLQIKMN